MDSPVTPLVSSPVLPAALPSWTLPRGREPDEIAAAFGAGIALKSLDDLVRSAPVWAGCWRSRQALKCAAAAVRLIGRNEDEAALRDAVLLTAVGGDPGPAGKLFLGDVTLSSGDCALPTALGNQATAPVTAFQCAIARMRWMWVARAERL